MTPPIGVDLLHLLLGSLISVPPLDFHGRLRVVRSVLVPVALHGFVASFAGHE